MKRLFCLLQFCLLLSISFYSCGSTLDQLKQSVGGGKSPQNKGGEGLMSFGMVKITALPDSGCKHFGDRALMVKFEVNEKGDFNGFEPMCFLYDKDGKLIGEKPVFPALKIPSYSKKMNIEEKTIEGKGKYQIYFIFQSQDKPKYFVLVFKLNDMRFTCAFPRETPAELIDGSYY
ncbi:MAG: hypothetical protein JW728_06260 [Candidatus Aureabacteria bacterium]|nr:hypothetical protein [Candidatus Auribacterota bacterium]